MEEQCKVLRELALEEAVIIISFAEELIVVVLKEELKGIFVLLVEFEGEIRGNEEVIGR